MSQRDPIRVFVTHSFEEGVDYMRVFEYLESARNFYYRNCSVLNVSPPAEVVIALASLLAQQQDMLMFQLHYAKASHKRIVLLPQFGHDPPHTKAFDALIDERVAWDERALVDAVKRQARHEETSRWDTIEFKLD